MRVEGGETMAVLRTVTARVREQNLTFLAGSLAYNAFVSLIPLLLLLLLVVGAVGNDVFATRVAELTGTYLTTGAQEEIAAAIDNAGGELGLSVTGVLVLLWGALKLFRGLDTAFAEVYETEQDPNLLKQFRDGLVALTVIGLSLVALALAGTAFAYFRLPLLHVLNPLFLLVGLSLAFLPMYYVFPDVEMTVRDALPGAVVAAGGWAILEVGFQVYATYAGQYEAYGVVGGILLLLTWLYFGGFVLLVGAAVNAVIRERDQSGLVAAATDEATESEDGVARATPGGDTATGAATTEAKTVETDAVTTEATSQTNGGTASKSSSEDARFAAESARSGHRERNADSGRRRPTRSIVAAFAVGVLVGFVAVVAAALGVGR
ncbi:YihY/virulence factor BrkB family protein [Halogeometricum limi]|uniref:Membrane protein n=1 Tax=Halogeometricum limi TaxID=555875 RepID=A0A1I6ISY5_9EURY|nr:YihY/virulence factor BrkB family protein [Halogeometricum limi]SFR69854.1 membrane protein [Halogeometricum limi]